MEQFNSLVYQKGSWVLHMLRAQLGDELYRRCIKTNLERHQFGNVVTEDLRAVVEELSGRSYDQFFDQWLYHAHYPEIEAEYSWDQKSKFAKISIKQVQKISDNVLLFNFPLTVRFKGKFGKIEQTISVKEKEEDFYFALDSAPETVRLDPNFDLLARVKFKLPNAMLYGFYGSAKGLLKATNDVQPIVFRKYDKPMEQFNSLVYQKGSWVLHMLRAQLGDELYRRCIKTYLERHQFGNVVTEDLRAVVEELSGRSYDQFFDQWLYHAHYPEIEAEYSWDQKSKFAKISIKQIQKLSDDVLLFNFPLTIRFKGKFGKVEQTISVKEKEEDFHFALDSAAEIARLDPNFDLLARVKFKLPNAMLYAQLADKDDMMGRLAAIDQLAEKKDHETIKRLKHALDDDPFFGVRIEAAKALQTIHEDEALDALLATKQKDARVRNQVAASIGGFFNGNSFERAISNISKEKNPDIRAQWIRALGNFSKPESRDVLIPLLQSDSYRNLLADAAIAAMRAQDDPVYINPILATLGECETNFTSRGFVAGLDALAYISRNEKKKDFTREFLIRHVNDRKQAIQVGAIAALGTLEDPEAIAVLETFANTGKDTPERKAAEKSLSAIRSAGKPSDDLKKLREEMLDLQKANRENKKQIEALNKKLENKTQKPTARAIRSPRDQP
jgi:aminopeptidase N